MRSFVFNHNWLRFCLSFCSPDAIYVTLAQPANILLDECGHVRISDLGLTYDVSENWPTSAVGTHGYTAPEVLQKGIQYAFSADWYSLGCTVYKLLVGTCPFRQFANKGGRFSEATTGAQKVGSMTLLSGLTQPWLSPRYLYFIFICYDFR